MDTNVGPGEVIVEDGARAYAMLEQLPARLRQLFQDAPYDYAVRPWFEEWLKHRRLVDEDRFRVAWARRMLADRRSTVIETYGLDHPMARLR